MPPDPIPIERGMVRRLLAQLKRAHDEERVRAPAPEEMRACTVSSAPPPVVTAASILETWKKCGF
jgi:hypothetical protein